MGVATRNESRRDAMRDRILDATERLLARLGYQKMTMDDVAHEAGISKRTIYLHFPSKEEVALGSIDRIVERLKGRLRALAAGGSGPADRLRRMLLERVLFRFDSVRDYYEGIDEIFRSLRPAYMARRRRYFDEEAMLFAGVLAEGKSSGSLAIDDPLATAHTLLLATNALLPSALSTRELGDREEVRQKAARIADVLLSGLLRRDLDPATRPVDPPNDT
jgi:AcrR family transcriptional regulator